MLTTKIPKKLIEVALPLDDINAACAYEKMPGIGAHPRGIHLWWARRPLAAARAVLFAQLVNDPGYERHLGRGLNKEKAAAERERLFGIIRDLVKWENTKNEEVLERARQEILKSWRETCALNKDHPNASKLFNPNKLPSFHDPFAGGGSIPLEAQRLGLEVWASDLNPVAVTINKAMIEIPPKFIGCPPVGPFPKNEKQSQTLFNENWTEIEGLAEDVRRYATWMHEQAKNRIGDLYPDVEITKSLIVDRPDLKPFLGKKLPAIAWIWVRTVKSPNPAFSHVHVPLASTFILSTKTNRETWVEPIIQGDQYRFTIHVGKPSKAAKDGTNISRGAFRCILSDTPIKYEYIDEEANAGRMGYRLMAVVADGPRGRVYLPPIEEQESAALRAKPTWKSDAPCRGTFASNAQGRIYGFRVFGDYFTPRQLLALTTLSDLIQEVIPKIYQDAIANGMRDDGKDLNDGGKGASAYAQAVGMYLSFAVDRCADFSNAVTRWVPGNEKVMNLFSKQAIPMTWDFPEAAILSDTVGGFLPVTEYIADCLEKLSPKAAGFAMQSDAQRQTISQDKIISTDPPYYNNIGYADLSDFFYVWLRRTLRPIFPDLFATIAVPKAEELVATQYRHGDKEKAEAFFLTGMTEAMHRLSEQAHPAFPITIYYAFKQSETRADTGTISTGWETFLEAINKAGLQLCGTWPMRSEQEYRMIGMGTNALASSIVLVCRTRPRNAPSTSRREFLRELNASLPEALIDMTLGGINSPVAPVDLSQAIIGPGMAIFSKYSTVLEADGKPMSIRTALQLINRFLAEDDFDHDTQFCLHWFENYGWGDGLFGDANTLAQAKGTSVDGVRDAGVIESGGGRVRLLRFNEYPSDWSPKTDGRAPVWEALHHLIRALQCGGESAAGDLLAHMPGRIESIRQLAYRLYTLCERKGWAEDARSYNELITSWEATEAVSLKASKSREKQIEMEL